MNDSFKQFNDVPVSLFLAVSIVVVFSMYVTTAIKTIPCGKDIMSLFLSNFVHIDLYHLMVNLFALYALSRVERELGAKKFISLIVFLLIFTSVTEVMIHKVYPQMPCSIGFSGVLFGIMTWELVTKKELDIVLIFTIIGMVVLPSIENSKASLLGHSVGAVSGVIGGLLWKKLSVLFKLNN